MIFSRNRKYEVVKSSSQIKNIYFIMRKICSVNVKAMLLRVNVGHIAAADKAVLSSKTAFSACFRMGNIAHNQRSARNVLWRSFLCLHTFRGRFYVQMIFISEYRGYRTSAEIKKKAFCVICLHSANCLAVLCRQLFCCGGLCVS